MKYNVDKDSKQITLTVTLSKKEMKSEDSVAFGYRSARQYLLNKGHNIGRLLSHKAAANKGSHASKDGKFVFELEQKVEKKAKTTTTTAKRPTTSKRTATTTQKSDQ